MELCYDGALVMPSNYAVMSEEEMTYVEGGGFSVKRLWYNIVGLAGQYAVVKALAKRTVVHGKSIYNWAVAGVSWARSKAINAVAKFCVKTGVKVATVSRVLAAACITGGAAAAYYFGTHRIFY